MILVSVGTQLPFDRLVRAVDEWARVNSGIEVIAQIGPSTYRPHTLKAFAFLDQGAFLELQKRADLHISHAGMGSILTAMEYGKPIIVMPRDFGRGEHRNGHQAATARRFADTPGVHVAADVAALADQLSQFRSLGPPSGIAAYASAAFTNRLRDYLDSTRAGRG